MCFFSYLFIVKRVKSFSYFKVKFDFQGLNFENNTLKNLFNFLK